jgi:glycosyltransferase involved in cell wall biosynthesis
MTYVILSTQFWSDNWVSKHWIAHWLAERGEDVYFVEPFRDRSFRIGNFLNGPSIRRVGKVRVVSFASLPYYYHVPALLKPIWRMALKRQFRAFSKLLEPNGYDLITFDGRCLPFLEMLPPPRASAYYCVDPVYVGEEERFSERNLMDKVDRVFAISTACEAALRRQSSNAEIEIIPHGIDFHGVTRSPSAADEASRPPDLPVGEPLIGYTGSVHDIYVDFEKIYRAARERPDWTFAFIGPHKGSDIAQDASRRINDLMNLPNVHFLGSKPYQELKDYIREFDLCLIPYRHDIDNGWEKRSPVKVLHYLSLGKPIVCADVPAAADYGELIFTYRSYAEFFDAIERALAEKPNARIRKARMEMAESRDCDVIVDKILASLG